MKKGRGVIAVLCVLLIIALGAVIYLIYTAASNDINGVNQSSAEYTLTIGENDYEYEVGQKLSQNKIVLNDVLWTNWMANHYPDFEYISGEYLLSADMSYEEIAKKLQAPDVSHELVKIVVPEGFNVMEIAERLEENGVCGAAEFLEVCKSTDGFDYDFLSSVPDSDLIAYRLEGFLFPATYDFAKNSDPHKVADKMLDTFRQHMTDAMQQFCDENEMTLYEFLTLASIVQEEALTNESAANITSVFMNRLHSNTKLQSDVTYFYARDLRDKYGFSDNVFDAYYTYTCPALPAGPITNSGDAIIDAVIHYPETDYYFFFSDLNKEFHFAKDYNEFMKLQEQYPWKE